MLPCWDRFSDSSMAWVLSELVGDSLHWARCLHSPGALRQSGEPLSVSSAQWPGQDRAEQAECPRLLPWAALTVNLWDLGELWNCGHWAGNVWESECPLSVPVLLATMCSGYQECHLWSTKGLDMQSSVSKGQQWGGWAQIPARLWGLLRAGFSRKGTVSWAKWPLSIGFHARGHWEQEGGLALNFRWLWRIGCSLITVSSSSICMGLDLRGNYSTGET